MNRKEYGTVIFALEEYAKILEKEKDISTRNYVYELIWTAESERDQAKGGE